MNPAQFLTAVDGRNYQLATENPNSLTGPEILGLPAGQQIIRKKGVVIAK
jgi:hypothetical protein